MRKIFNFKLSGCLCFCIAVLLVFASIGTAQQHTKQKPLIGAFGSALLGGAIGGGAVFAIFAAAGEHPYGFVLLPVGSIPGSTLGIWLYDKENCSIGATTTAALLTTGIFTIVGATIGARMDETGLGILWGACFGGLTSPLTTTFGYWLGRRKQSSATMSLLNIEKTALRFGIPAPVIRPVMLSKEKVAWEFQISLVSAQF